MAEIKLPSVDGRLGVTALMTGLVAFQQQFGGIAIEYFYGLCAIVIAYIAGHAYVEGQRARTAHNAGAALHDAATGEVIGKEKKP